MPTSEKKILENGKTKSPSYQGDFLVNLFPLQEKKKEMKMNATCGERCIEQSNRFPRLSLSQKMCRDYLLRSTRFYSSKCALTWKTKGTKFNRLLFQLVALTLHTEGTGFGLSLSPTITLKGNYNRKGASKKKRERIRNSDTNASDLLITKQERYGSTWEGGIEFTNDNQFTANDNGKRQQEQRKYRGWSSSEENEEWEADKFINGCQFKREWTEVASKFCRVDDGVSKELDRQKRIEALGNAIVPQVAFEVFGIVDHLIANYKIL